MVRGLGACTKCDDGWLAGLIPSKAHGMGWDRRWLAGVLVVFLWGWFGLVCIFAPKTNYHDRDWEELGRAGERWQGQQGQFVDLDG